jgi:hypothetical protein
MTFQMGSTAMAKRATLYRMVTDEHVCPSGLKSRDLLDREGFSVDDHHLTTRGTASRVWDAPDQMPRSERGEQRNAVTRCTQGHAAATT